MRHCPATLTRDCLPFAPAVHELGPAPHLASSSVDNNNNNNNNNSNNDNDNDNDDDIMIMIIMIETLSSS